ncbi:hypothetical protein D3C79_765810 [compost metagenome]
MHDPRRDKPVPFVVIAPGADGVRYRGDTEQALIFCLVNPAQPAFEAMPALFEMNRQCAFDQERPALQQLTMALQQIRQGLNQLGLQELAKTGKRQQAASLQAAGLSLQGWLGIVRVGQRGIQQALGGAVALQRIEDERFFIWGRSLQGFEEHLESLTEEVPHRVAKKVVQLCQAQRFIIDVWRQAGVVFRDALPRQMQYLPFMGETEQRAALLEVARAERL